MNEMELFRQLTDIDDDLILEAHETPEGRSHLHFGGLRRAAVLLAAVLLMLVTVVAADGGFGVLRPSGWVRGTFDTDFESDYENRVMIVRESGTYQVEGNLVAPAESLTRAQATEFWTSTVCDGQMIQIIQEAVILMEDNHCEYKSQVTEGFGEVVAVMDNLVDGVAGEICNVRLTVAVLTEESESYDGRQSTPGPDGKVWVLLQNWNFFLPTQLDYEYPSGVDFRFPDMQYNYDGRGSASK